MHRRAFIQGATGLGITLMAGGRPLAQDPVFLADMHFHLFFGGRNPVSRNPLAKLMKDGNATLVNWAMVGDSLWFDNKPPHKQHRTPTPGEPLGYFRREIGRMRDHLAAQKLKTIRGPADVAHSSYATGQEDRHRLDPCKCGVNM